MKCGKIESVDKFCFLFYLFKIYSSNSISKEFVNFEVFDEVFEDGNEFLVYSLMELLVDGFS